MPSTPDDPADAVRTALRIAVAARRARPRHHRRDQRPARARARPGRAGQQRGASPTSSRSPARRGPSLYDHARRPAGAARAARAALRGVGAARRRRPEIEAFDGTVAALDAIGRRRRGRGLPAARRPRPGPRASGRPTCCVRTGRTWSCSHEVSPGVPRVRAHGHDGGQRRTSGRCAGRTCQQVAALAGDVLVMTSAGGLVPLADAAEHPASAAAVRARPAGVPAAAAVAAAAASPDAVTFDMGGTSTDVCLVRGGRPEPAAERAVAGFPVRLPALDVHTIGAGGGSIAADRRRRRAGGRAAERRRRTRAGLLRAGRTRADRHRRRPRARAASRRRRRSPASAASTRARRGPRSSRAGVTAERRRRRRRRGDGAGGAGGDGRAGRRPA